MSKETSLVAPVAIRQASICIFASAFISYCVQLSHTMRCHGDCLQFSNVVFPNHTYYL